MSVERLVIEPILDESIVEQNLELLGDRFPEILINEWEASTLPLIRSVCDFTGEGDVQQIYEMSHKAAGSTLQIGGNRLGLALREISHLLKAESIDPALTLIKQLNEFLSEFTANFVEKK